MTVIASDIVGPLASGLILGLAGSIHCACMCGGIASGSLLIMNPETPAARLRTLLQLQAGRVCIYVLAGGTLAGVAGLTIGPNATATTYKVLQWISAAILMWFGFSMAGLVPRIALPATLGTASTAIKHLLAPARRQANLLPFALGMTWGMTPCPMVYAALIPAMLTGSAVRGMAWMLGFGLGTIPAVTAAALGISFISRVRRWRGAEIVAGLAVALFGLFSATSIWPRLVSMCGLN